MVIVETAVFTEQIVKLLPDDEYRRLQIALVLRPEQGTLIPGAAGLRKIRWRQPGRGKRGGLRVLYYWDQPADRLYMIFVHEKSRAADLTAKQVKALSRLVREELRGEER